MRSYKRPHWSLAVSLFLSAAWLLASNIEQARLSTATLPIVVTGTNISCPSCASSATAPIILAAGNISCPTCATSLGPSGTGGLTGGLFGVAGTQFRAPWALVSAAAFDYDNPLPVGGWLRNHTVYISEAMGDSSRMVVVPENATAGPAGGSFPVLAYGGFVLISGNAAGSYADPLTATFLRIERYAFYNLRATAYYSNNSTLRGWMAEFVTDNASAVIGSPTDTTDAAGAGLTVFNSPFNDSDTFAAADEVLAQFPMRYAATAQNLLVVTEAAQVGTGSCVIVLRSSAADTALTVTVPAGAAQGLYADVTNTVALAAGALINLGRTNNGAVGSCALRSWQIELVPSTVGDFFLGFYGPPANIDANLRFSPPFARSGGNLTEGFNTAGMPRAGTLDNCALVHGLAGAAGTVTVTLRHNLAASAITGSYAADSALGLKTLAGSVSVLKGETVSLSMIATVGTAPGIAGTACRFR